MRRVESLIKEAVNRLIGTTETPTLDAQVLLANVLGKTRTWIIAHPEYPITDEQAERYERGLHQLVNGEPLPFILGKWEFFGLELIVSPDTLIPRPETELLVEKALSWLHAYPTKKRVADIGTGSGCVAIALANNCPRLTCLATDISYPAIRIARQNVEQYDLTDRVFCFVCDLLPPIAIRLDLVCANLPYIPTSRLKELPVFTREPALALDGGQQGLDLISRLLGQVGEKLNPGSLILLEIDSSQESTVLNLARDAFPSSLIASSPDLSGQPRLISIQLPE